MAELKIQLPQVPNNEWKDAQYPFDGAWMPDVDSALIGARNFAVMRNLRYNNKSIEGINGYCKINSTTKLDTTYSNYSDFRNGFQLRSDHTQKSYNLAHVVHSSTGQGRVFVHTGTLGAAGDFAALDLDVSGNPYYQDSAVNLVGRFSTAPQNSIGYCNGKESMIFSGYEHRIASIFQAQDAAGGGVIDKTDDLNSAATSSYVTLQANLITDGDMEDDPATNMTAVSGATLANESTIVKNGSQSLKVTANGANDGFSTTATISAQTTYRISCWVYPDDDTKVTLDVDDDIGGLADASHTLNQDAWNLVTIEVTTNAAATTLTVQFDSGATAAGDWFFDDLVVVEDGNCAELIMMTTRPAQAIKTYIGTQTSAGVLDIDYWSGSGYTDITTVNGGTAGTTTLAATGSHSFDHTSSVVKFRHFQELYLYSYRVRLSTGKADIYNITADYGFQPIQNVWDGVYRQPIQFQIFDVDHYEDYTLHVNQSSDINTPVGGVLDGLTTTDHVIVMFEEKISGMRHTMLGDLVSTTSITATYSYWDGFAWQSLTVDDGTLSDDGTKPFNQSGLVSWTPQSDEQKQTLFNNVGYAYKITFSGALTGAKGGSEEVVVDIVNGIPALSDAIKPFDFSVLYKNRLMLGAFSEGAEANRMDFSVSNAPDVWNGSQSSEDGLQSLYFGGVEAITCATQLYNRFGASVFSMLLVLKDTEVYLMVGDTPNDFTVYPVSQTTGCPAPLTLAVAEVGFEVGQGLSRNVAIWLSNSGPMMFDGAIISSIKGIDNYFDPGEDEYIEWDVMSRARGWVDQVHKEYNLLIPSESGSSENNTWLAYDLIRKKWFEKDCGSDLFPQCAWNVMDPDTGEQFVFGGVDDGYMIHIGHGTSWNCTYADLTSGSGIVQKLRTGDFFPSDNIWDEILIRKFKLICQKIPSSVSTTANNLSINYYQNSASDGANVIFQDSEASSGVYVDFQDMDVDADGVKETQWQSSASAVLNLSLNVGLDRIVRLIQDLNKSGWAHSFEFEVTTDDVPKGWQPIVWGIRYRIERKDETATADNG